MIKRLLYFVVLLVALCALGCGGGPAKCSVPIGHGAPGICSPAPSHPGTFAAPHGTTFPDLSNNNPVYDMRPIFRAGHPAVWLKVNEGTRYIDPTFAPMVRAARSAGLAPGGYDFVRNYNAGEANLFVQRLRATGTCRSAHTLPPTLDIEVGSASRSGVQAMVNVVRKACGRVAIYTGLWYWNPHLGNWWPSGVAAWISGYPSIVGRANYSRVSVHQYTDKGWNGARTSDMNIWLGGSFKAFVNTSSPKPVPKPVPVPHPKPKPAPQHYPFHSKRGNYRVVLKGRHRWHYYGPHDRPKVRVK